MLRRSLLGGLAAAGSTRAASLRVSTRQVTFGPRHHLFGYIGHVGNIPWNGNGRYALAFETAFQERMPHPGEPATIVLLDVRDQYKPRAVDQTRAWNLQQGTMFYWDPLAPDTRFFFNDRDPSTHEVFIVLYDIAAGRRVREFRHPATPFGNSGVAQKGGWFLGINYGRLARLRPVTGYPGAKDWTLHGELQPDNDGIFRVDTATGAARLLVSFRQIASLIPESAAKLRAHGLFINHTLSNRDGDRVYFYARADFAAPGDERVNVPFVMKPDGTGLTRQKVFIGGHPEWESGHRMIGLAGGRQVLYDTDSQQVVGTMGSPETFPDPGGDVALSPDGRWFVNGYRQGDHNRYVFYRRSDGASVRSEGFNVKGWTSGDLRCDPAPCWNRNNREVMFPAIAGDGTRQLFVAAIASA